MTRSTRTKDRQVPGKLKTKKAQQSSSWDRETITLLVEAVMFGPDPITPRVWFRTGAVVVDRQPGQRPSCMRVSTLLCRFQQLTGRDWL